MAATRPPLGGLSPDAFLRDYWQKRPLLVRQAIPRFAGVLDKRRLFDLATKDDAEARLIRSRPRWRVNPGPLERSELDALPERDWTLLVNGINLHVPAADRLLARFAFLSWARLDDVMVSYAADRGGVGPHVDSYDVFLLQGPGRRRWRLMPPARRPFEMVSNAPLKQIAQFKPREDMTLEPGDMLYLPPGWGHDGTAIGACQTYSIGFRAPGGAELSAAFLDFLHERGFEDSEYRDPHRTPSKRPGRIDRSMIDHAARALAKIRWDRSGVASFVGRYLSEPKPQVVFDAPRRPMSQAAFVGRLRKSSVMLDARTRMLTHGARVFMNGTESTVPVRSRAAFESLADRRAVEGGRLADIKAADLLFEWYTQGFVALGDGK